MLLRVDSFFSPSGGEVTLESEAGSQGGFATSHDVTVTVPSGSNRLLIDFAGFISTTISSWALDPTVANEALTQFTGSPLGEGAAAAWIGETGISNVGTGSKTLRIVTGAGRRTGRQYFIFSGAAQTTPPSANNEVDPAGGALTITLTGTYDAGTYLAACCFSSTSATGAYTVSGTGGLVELEDIDITTDNTHWVAAGVLLAGSVTDPTVIFTRDGGGNTVKSGFMVAVEPA